MLTGCASINNKSALQISSKPEASVFLDGKHLGKTPYFSDQIKPGTYTLKISAGEATYVDRISLIQGSLTVVERQLNDNILAQSGHVLWLEEGKNDFFANSTPTDSQITIDGKFYGKTPLLIPSLESGDHKVSITKIGYKDHDFSIKISKTNRLVANVTLEQDDTQTSLNSNQAESKNEIEVQKTPQGYLRVRKEPDLNSLQIARLENGEKLEIIQETD